MEQLELAESIGLSRATVSGYERGATLPKRPVLVAWAMVTGVSLEWIEGGEEEVELPRVDSNHQPAGYMPTAA
jgi:transcriptional regulator with XRE-family HTH domain